jgi:hypothetical protein
MKKTQYKMRSKVWLYPGMAGWHFITVPKKKSEEIKKKYGKNAKGWGSIPVKVSIGGTTWLTSIFPDKRSGTYVLPIKAAVRKKEEIMDTDTITFGLDIQLK